MSLSSIGSAFSLGSSAMRPRPAAAEERTGTTEGDAAETEKQAKPVEPGAKKANGAELAEEDLKQLQQLQARDREVRAHEAAHMAAAGGLATGGASFTYQKGPDGGNYAVGGEVNIDTSPVADDPEATIRKAETIRRAALAPADPSSQDRQVAAAASQMQTEALSELGELRRKQQSQSAKEYLQMAAASPDAERRYQVHLQA